MNSQLQTISWLARLRNWWSERRQWKAELRQAKRERREEEKEASRLARRWASANLVAELRRMNETLSAGLAILERVLQANDADSRMADRMADCPPEPDVEVDEVISPEQAEQEAADRELGRIEHGEFGGMPGNEEGNENAGIDRVDDMFN